MGYFKRRREQRAKEIKEAIIQSAKVSNTLFKQEIGYALNEVELKRYEFEDNMRYNLSEALMNPALTDRLISEVAKVIEDRMQLYTFKLAKDKRDKLARDILFDLAEEK